MSDLSTLNISEHPFPGLRPYRYTEYDIFFGRKKHVDEMLGIMESNHFLAVVGPSGCGKSSLVRAGLRPALSAGRIPAAGSLWSVVTIRPGNQPFETLSRKLCRIDPFHAETKYEHYEASLLSSLKRDSYGLIDEWSNLEAVSEYKEDDLPPLNLLLIIDQFEEIFRFDNRENANEYREFVNLLLTTSSEAQSRSLSIYVVLTMRSDFLGHCPQFTGLPEALNCCQYLTPRLTRDQIRQAIVGPLALRNSTIEPRVVNEILNDMGTDPDQLPLMQHLMMRMWRHVQLARTEGPLREELIDSAKAYDILESSTGEITYRGDVHLDYSVFESVGKLNGALENHLEYVYLNRLKSDRQRLIAENLFRSLTTVTPEGQLIRSPTRLKDIPRPPGVSIDEVREVIDVFRAHGRYFLMPAISQGLLPETFIDITHESLIRKWKRLNDWTWDESKRKKVEHRTREKFENWKKDPENPDKLIYGTDLAEALELFQNRDRASVSAEGTTNAGNRLESEECQFQPGVSPEMKTFLVRSVEKRDEAARAAAERKFLIKMKKLARVASAFAVVAAILAVLAGWLNLSKARTLSELSLENKTNASMRLIRDAGLAEQNPQLQLLLSAEALRIAAGIAEPDARADLDIPETALPAFQQIDESTKVLANLRRVLSQFESFGLSSRVLGRLDDPDVIGTSATSVRVSGISVLSWNCPNERHQWLATGTDRGQLFLWNLLEDKHDDPPQIFRSPSHKRITKVAFRKPAEDSGLDPLVVWGDQSGRMWMSTYNPAEHRFQREIEIRKLETTEADPDQEVTDISFSGNGRWLVAANNAGELRVWDTRHPEQGPTSLFEPKSHGAVKDILFVAKSQDGNFNRENEEYLVAVGAAGFARIWKLSESEPDESSTEENRSETNGDRSQLKHELFAIMEGHHATITDVDESQNGAWLATADTSGKTMLWKLTDVLTKHSPPGSPHELEPITKPPTEEELWGVTFTTRQITFGPGNDKSGKQLPPWLFAVNDSVQKGGSVAEYYALDLKKWSPGWSVDSLIRKFRTQEETPAYSTNYPLFTSSTENITQISNLELWFAAVTERGKVLLKYFPNLPLVSAPYVGQLPEIEIRGHDGPILEAAFYTDNDNEADNENDNASTAPKLVTVGADNQIRVWDLSQLDCRFDTPFSEFPEATANSPDGRMFATLARSKDELTRDPAPEYQIRIWRESDHERHIELKDFSARNPSPLVAFLFERDDSLVAIFEDRQIVRWQKSGTDNTWDSEKKSLSDPDGREPRSVFNWSDDEQTQAERNIHTVLKEDRKITTRLAPRGQIALSPLKRSTDELILIDRDNQIDRYTLNPHFESERYFLDFAMRPNSDQVALALSNGQIIIASPGTDADETSKFLDIERLVLTPSFNRKSPLNLGDRRLCFDRSGDRLFVAASDGWIRSYDLTLKDDPQTILEPDILRPEKISLQNLVFRDDYLYRASALGNQLFFPYGTLDIISVKKRESVQSHRIFNLHGHQQIGFDSPQKIVLTYHNGTRHFIQCEISDQTDAEGLTTVAENLLEKAENYAGRNLTIPEWEAAFKSEPKKRDERLRTFPEYP